MKQRLLLALILLMIPFVSRAQSGDMKWAAGLHGAPLFPLGYYSTYTGFEIFPGAYRSYGPVMIGFNPYYGKISDKFQGSFFNPADQRKRTISSFGLNLQGRYFLNSKRLSPYTFVMVGVGSTSERLERAEEFGGGYTNKSPNLNLGLGIGATYDIGDLWKVDLAFQGTLFKSFQSGPGTMLLFPSMGLIRKLW